MRPWLSTLIALVVLAAIAPAVARLGKRYGRAAKGNVALAAILLGFGEPADPPTHHLIEAKEEKPKARETSGDPPDPDSG